MTNAKIPDPSLDPNKSIPTFCRGERAIGNVPEDGVRLIFASEEEWRRQTAHPRDDPRFRQPSFMQKLVKSKRFYASIAVLFFTLLIVGLVANGKTIKMGIERASGVPPGLYSKDGTLYVGADTQFHIKGVSWYGLEEPEPMLGGLQYTDARTIFKFLQKHNFNAIRLPLSVENIETDRSVYHDMATFKNGALSSSTYTQFVKGIIKMAAKYNMLVLLDVHRLANEEVKSKGLWYTSEIPENRLRHVWKTLCKKMGGEWNVMGGDIFNEPWDAMWGTDEEREDWKLAAERLGNMIHEHCPAWTLFIQGVGGRAQGPVTDVFWAENLRVMEHKPPEIKLQNKVVLSPHVYGPGVHNQTYFEGEGFEENMPGIWDDHFGTVHEETGLATVIGEWGGVYTGTDKIWQDKFMEYMTAKGFGYFFWCVNPESADTGGLLQADWKTPEKAKLKNMEDSPFTSVVDHIDDFTYFRTWVTAQKVKGKDGR